METIIISLLIIPIVLTIGGIIKYNVELNRYIKQETTIDIKSETKSNVNRTEIHIVGTVHFQTGAIKRQDLYMYIDSISPSVILNGFYHRYYLINELKKYEEEFEFSIKEI